MEKYILFPLFCFLALHGSYRDRVKKYYNDHKKEIKMITPIALAAAVYLAIPPCAYVGYKRYEQHQIHSLLQRNGVSFDREDDGYRKMVALAKVAKENGLEGLKLQFRNKGDVDSFRYLCTAHPGLIDSLATLADVFTEDILSLRNNVILFDPNDSNSEDEK